MFDADVEDLIAMLKNLEVMNKYLTKVTYNIMIFGIGASAVWATISLIRIYYDYKRRNSKRGD